METEAFNEQAGRAKAHKYLATLSMHSSLTSLFQALKKEHLSDVFFPHLAHMEGELICAVKFYIGSSYFFQRPKREGIENSLFKWNMPLSKQFNKWKRHAHYAGFPEVRQPRC